MGISNPNLRRIRKGFLEGEASIYVEACRIGGINREKGGKVRKEGPRQENQLCGVSWERLLIVQCLH